MICFKNRPLHLLCNRNICKQLELQEAQMKIAFSESNNIFLYNLSPDERVDGK